MRRKQKAHGAGADVLRVLKRHASTGALLVLLAGILATPTAANDCPGDLNGDNEVTIDEIITAINSALNGCPDTAPALSVGCPGDLNGDNQVTIDEIITAVITALNGCPTPTPSPTGTPGPPLTPTATATPTATPTSCPFTFTDNTLDLGVSCGYLGPFSDNPDCPAELNALVLGDGNGLVAVSVGSDPLITFGGTVVSPTSANIIAYFVGDDPTVHPLAGVMELQNDGLLLVIDPSSVPDFNIGGAECSFDRYEGTFTQVVTG